MESSQNVRTERDQTLILALILLVSIGASLPMAWISLAKLGLIIFGLYALINLRSYAGSWQEALTPTSMRLLVLAIALSGLSMLWSIVPMEHAVHTWLKHAKLLTVLMLTLLLTTEARANLAMKSLLWAQSAVILLSWLIIFGLPWPRHESGTYGVVFAESYIDQSAMFCISGALAWHLRDQNLWPKWLVQFVVVAGIANVLFVMPGRTGYMILIALVTASVFWAAPKKIRWVSLIVAPVLLVTAAWFASPNTRSGLERAANETRNFAYQPETHSSSGWRLNAWHRSLEAIALRPLIGYGVGSFVPAVKSVEKGDAASIFGTNLSSNPHQEFLLWGVELGITGVFLFVGLLWYFFRWAQSFSIAAGQAVTSVLLAITVACLFNSALFDDLIGDFLCFALGISLAYGRLSSTHFHKTI